MAEMLEPVARPLRLAEAVAARLEGWMKAGGLAPGGQLPSEKVLAERFGVSRAVIREAVSRLKAEGWVDSRQGAGAFATSGPGRGSFRVLARGGGQDDSMADIFELRHVVEAGVAELAARRRKATDLADLEAALAAMDGALAGGSGGAAADDAFHVAIAAATGNPLLRRFTEFMGQQFSASRVPTWDETGRAAGRAAAAQVEHRRIFAALQAGDPEAARQAATAHLVAVAERLGVPLPGDDRIADKEQGDGST